MRELLVRNWWALAARAAVAFLFGTLVLLLPGLTLDALVALVAAYAFADGVLTIIAALRAPGRDRRAAPRREALLLEGITGTALGLGVALWPGETVLVVLLLVAARALATGAFELLAAWRLRGRVPGVVLLGLAGALSVALGVFLLVATAAGTLRVVSWIGVHALAFGTLLLVLALRLRAHRAPAQRRRASDAAAVGLPEQAAGAV